MGWRLGVQNWSPGSHGPGWARRGRHESEGEQVQVGPTSFRKQFPIYLKYILSVSVYRHTAKASFLQMWSLALWALGCKGSVPTPDASGALPPLWWQIHYVSEISLWRVTDRGSMPAFALISCVVLGKSLPSPSLNFSLVLMKKLK